MDIQSLQYFLTIYDYRSITKAAEVLHISQPALSRRLQDLEHECGVTLITRGKRYVELTPAGEHFLVNARKIVARQEKVLQELEFYKQDVDLRIGFVPDINMKGVLKIQATGKRFLQDTALGFFETAPSEIPNMLLSGKIDIAYTMLGEVADIKGLKYVVQERNNLSVVIPVGHKLWHKHFVTCEDLIGETLYICSTGNDFGATNAKVIDFIAEKLPGVDLRRKNSSGVLLDICAGNGIGLNGIYCLDTFAGSNEFYKNIVISDAAIPYGDMVLAYKADNKAAEEYVNKISEILKS